MSSRRWTTYASEAERKRRVELGHRRRCAAIRSARPQPRTRSGQSKREDTFDESHRQEAGNGIDRDGVFYLQFTRYDVPAVVGVTSLLPGGLSTAINRKKTFTMLHTNDLNSSFIGRGPAADYTPFTLNDDATCGGYARLAALIAARQAARQGQGPVLVLDAGDFSMLFYWPGAEEYPRIPAHRQSGPSR
jgi:hypothetical protein